MTTEELLPCPFCGSADIREIPDSGDVCCYKCGSSTRRVHWNRRCIQALPRGYKLVPDSAAPGVEGRREPQRWVMMPTEPTNHMQRAIVEAYWTNRNLDMVYHAAVAKRPAITPPTDALAPQSGKKGDGWIDVKERLPEKRDEYYLVAGRLSTGRYEVSYKHFSLNGYFDGTIPNHSHVAYWMPLPSPPSKAEGE